MQESKEGNPSQKEKKSHHTLGEIRKIPLRKALPLRYKNSKQDVKPFNTYNYEAQYFSLSSDHDSHDDGKC